MAMNVVVGDSDVYYSTTTLGIDYPTRPLGGYTSGATTYHNYPGFYFNDNVSNCDSFSVCGAGDGDWNNINNWWTNETFTIHAPTIPQRGDKVYVYSDVLKNTGNSASVDLVTFNGGVKNNISVAATAHNRKAQPLCSATRRSTTFVWC